MHKHTGRPLARWTILWRPQREARLITARRPADLDASLVVGPPACAAPEWMICAATRMGGRAEAHTGGGR